jgi:hypothetical protein
LNEHPIIDEEIIRVSPKETKKEQIFCEIVINMNIDVEEKQEYTL